jgi:hypothetical protein
VDGIAPPIEKPTGGEHFLDVPEAPSYDRGEQVDVGGRSRRQYLTRPFDGRA